MLEAKRQGAPDEQPSIRTVCNDGKSERAGDDATCVPKARGFRHVRDHRSLKQVGEGLVFRRVPDLLDLAGVDAKYGSPEEAKRLIERMREEY